MGADAFSAWYGLRIPIDVAGLGEDAFDEAIAPYEDGSDSRMAAAQSVGLDAWMDRDTDGGTHYLAIGTSLGRLGLEHKTHVEVHDNDLDEIQLRTRALLIKAGLGPKAALHLQFLSQY